MEIVFAQIDQLEAAARLFDHYRVFYEQSSDLAAARHFLQERLEAKDSAIFLAVENARAIGFAQLYPSFSSVAMKRIWILNDLFVERSHRNQGIARLLMNAAKNHARDTGAIRINLSTQTGNAAAQSLYESLGYKKDSAFYHYGLPL
ncbi:MAG: GNAT family N-acetyltransferase [Phormidesmis sp.]